MSKSKIFLFLCAFFIGGIFISSFFRFPRLLWLGFLAIGILLSFVLSEYKKTVVIGLCIVSFLFGVFRYQTAELKAEGSEIKEYNDTEKELVVWGVVSAEPEVKENSIKYVIKTDFLDDGQKEAATSGNLLVVSGKYPEYHYCDRLKITGELESPVEIDGFDYEGYLKKEGIYSTVGFSKIELVAKDSCSGFISKIYKFVLFLKQQSRKTINKNLSPPGSSIVSAMILGDKSAIPANLRDKLSSAGVSHIVAVSGMHIVILMAVLTPLLFGLGLW
jgi:competence protein ComEC